MVVTMGVCVCVCECACGYVGVAECLDVCIHVRQESMSLFCACSEVPHISIYA